MCQYASVCVLGKTTAATNSDASTDLQVVLQHKVVQSDVHESEDDKEHDVEVRYENATGASSRLPSAHNTSDGQEKSER